MGQTGRQHCVWYTDKDGVRFREGDDVFLWWRGRLLRCAVLALYIEDNRPMVALGSVVGSIFVASNAVRVWPNGK